MTNNLKVLKKELKAFAKRVKDFKYTDSALITFLLTGMIAISGISFNLYSAEDEIKTQEHAINTSILQLQKDFKRARQENNRLLRTTNLELIQLMEQGDHVVKSPWSSWQYGMNYVYNDWQGTYKGRGDKKAKYPYEGVYQRSLDIYERSVSPDSDKYGLLSRNRRPNFALGSAAGYGIGSFKPVKEPIVPFEVNAGIRPRSINKSAIRIADKTAVTPTLPEAISFTPPKPVIGLPKLPELPVPPTFNIQLGSYCNSMVSCNSMHDEGGQYGYGGTTVGTVRSYEAGDPINITTNDPSLRYGWSDESGGHSALLYSYFDVTRGEDPSLSPQTSILNGNLTVPSINPVTSDSSLPDYNKQFFLVGGSRVATLDNVVNTTLENKATVNLEGPLTVGFEAQTDDYFKRNYDRGVTAFLPYASKQGIRGLTNSGTITDDSEKNNSAIQAHISPGNSMELKLADFGSGHSKITVKNTNGYLGYKVGMILTFENEDIHTNSNYILKNNGTIKINGEKSIGIQIFAPGSPSKVTVSNTGTGGKGIFMGGIESYGMKWSSRVAIDSTMENTGTIEISGDAGTETKPDGTVKILDSLSSGIAVIENKSY